MSSEERELPASERKLRQARQRGQVASSRDLTTAVALIAGVLYLTARFGGLMDQLTAIWTLSLQRAGGDVTADIRSTAADLAAAGAMFLLPLFAAMIAASFLADLMMKRGFVLSVEPLMPKFDAINPVTGFANLFKLAKLIDLIKALAKLALLGTGGYFVMAGFLNQALWVPRCGLDCGAALWVELVRMLAGVALAVFALNGLIDMKLQNWLFLRGMRMTKTEKKQEAKEQNSSPEMKAEVRHQARAGKTDRKAALQRSTLLVGDDSVIVGVRFVPDETPAPLCSFKARGANAKRARTEADRLGIPVHVDGNFADALFKKAKPGSFLPPPSYSALAQIFRQYGLLG